MKTGLKLIASIALCQLAGMIGSVFTVSSLGSWYQNITKPFFTPPGWVFGPVWITLYTLMGISLFLIWQLGWKKKATRTARNYFLAQLAANSLWSISFFGLQSPWLGLVNILVLLVLIILTLKKIYPVSKTAFYLMIPYLAWVSFATILNLSIAILN